MLTLTLVIAAPFALIGLYVVVFFGGLLANTNRWF